MTLAGGHDIGGIYVGTRSDGSRAVFYQSSSREAEPDWFDDDDEREIGKEVIARVKRTRGIPGGIYALLPSEHIECTISVAEGVSARTFVLKHDPTLPPAPQEVIELMWGLTGMVNW